MAIYHAVSDDIPGWGVPYRPLLRNGDLQTAAARYWPTSLDERRWPTETRCVQTEPGVEVLVESNRQAGSPATVVAVHGLTGCARANYMQALSRAALEAGFSVVRVNVRNCGGTEHLCPTLYHSGLTADLRAVVEQLAPEPVFVIGFSMGGNMAVKLAGEWGDEAPAHVLGVCGVSAPIWLSAAADEIGRRRNRIYEARFLYQLGLTLKRKAKACPDAFPPPDLSGLRSLRDFDERFTAPHFGYSSAEDYYEKASAGPYLGRIGVPTLTITAADDPFIPFASYSAEAAFRQNSALTLLVTGNGGHVAFLNKGQPRFWAQEQAVAFFRFLLDREPAEQSAVRSQARRQVVA